MGIDTTSLSSLPSLLLQEGVAQGGLNVPWSIVLLVVSVVAYALVNTVEIAVVGASRIRIRHLAESGNKSAQSLERLRQREDRFFASIVVLQNLSVFVASGMASLLALDLAGGWGLLFATVIVTSVIALFGEVTPKVLAARSSDTMALLVARPVELLIVVMRPIAAFFAAAPNFISRLFFGKEARLTPTVTEAELRMLIDIGAEEGAVGAEEAELMERVFRFHDRHVNEVMVPRTEVVWLEAGTSVREFYEVYTQSLHSRFPVYRDTLDSVVGIVNIKDVLRAVAQDAISPDQPIDGLMRPAHFVPETKLVGQLFVEMQDRRQQMAIVIDEYGGTAGVVTLEILIEEMVGHVVDELGQPVREFERIDAHTVRIDGGMSVQEAREELELPIPEGDYETIAGYVLDILGHIPNEGEIITGEGFALEVIEVKGRKIEAVEIRRLPAGAPEPAEASQ